MSNYEIMGDLYSKGPNISCMAAIHDHMTTTIFYHVDHNCLLVKLRYTIYNIHQ